VLWTAVVACALTGAASVLFLTTGNSTVQLASEPQLRGRVMALWSLALVGSTPIGSPIIGAVSQAASPRWALALGAAGCAVAAIIGARSPRHGRYAGQAVTRGSTITESGRAQQKHAA
jgi:MFS family permease